MAKRKKNRSSDYIGKAKGESLASIIFRDQNPLDNLAPVEELPQMNAGQSGATSSASGNSASSSTATNSKAQNKKSK